MKIVRKDASMSRWRNFGYVEMLFSQMSCPTPAESLRNRKHATVLEIGVGNGYLLKDVKERFRQNVIQTIGVDITDEFIQADTRKFIDRMIVGDALRLPFPKADVIISVYTLSYIGHPDYMLKKIAEALKPGGEAFLHLSTAPYSSLLYSGYLNRVPRDIKTVVRSPSYDALFRRIEQGRLDFGDVKVEFVKASKLDPKKLPQDVLPQDYLVYMHKPKKRKN
jgi:ubiquinone/menaquinone biosynthesis C-methylase UbiE